MRLLQWLGHGRRKRKFPVVAIMRIIAGPELLHGRHELLHIPYALLLRNAAGHAIELVLVRTARNPEFEASTGQVIAHGGFACEPDRGPVRRNQRRRSESDALRVLRQPSQDSERIRRNGAFNGVMLGGPERLEPAFIGYARQRKHIGHGGRH